jgi:hypothetical protein
MSKKSQEILYDSEVEMIQEAPIANELPPPLPQDIEYVAPKPVIKQMAPRAKTAVKTDIKAIFTCEFCHKNFARNYYLNRHIEDGRCNVKRNLDLSQAKQLKETEDKINLKIQQKELRAQKKLMKQTAPIKQAPVKQAPVKPVKPVAVYADARRERKAPLKQAIEPRKTGGFIVNF